MSVNPYFNFFGEESEQQLFDDLWVEAIEIYGMTVKYIPKKLNNLDKIFGQDSLMSFEKIYPIEMYFENVNGFDGENHFLSKFGYEVRKSANLTVSRRRFNEVVKEGAYNIPPPLASTRIDQPEIGDLIYIPLFKSYWEIKDVNHESTFYQLGKAYTWKITVEAWTYSGETVNTGDPEVDRVNRLLSDINTDIMGQIDDTSAFEEEKEKELLDFDPEHPFGRI